MFSYQIYLYTVVEKMRNEFIFIFYKKYVLHAIFLLIQDSPFIWAYPGKISLWWKHILIHTDTNSR